MSPGPASGGLLTLEALELQHLVHAGVERRAFRAGIHRHLLHRLESALVDAPDADASHVRGVVERADLQLQRRGGITLVRRHVPQDGVEQRREVGAGRTLVERGPAVQARGEDDREVELLLGGAQLVEQVEGGIDHVVGARAGAVDLVDHDDGLEAQRQRLLRDEAGLRHRAFHRIDQQQHAVDHRQHALHLAAEVGVPRRVDDVDVRALPLHRAVLRKDGDAALAFEVAAVHHPFGDFLVRAEGAALAQQLVDHGGLAVVDVGNDGDVADLSRHEGLVAFRRPSTSAGLRSLVEMSSPPATWPLPRNARGSGP